MSGGCKKFDKIVKVCKKIFRIGGRKNFIKNWIFFFKNYDLFFQVKVREATSNDPWGPSSTQMSEIADLTYNVVAFSEIMQVKMT
jgi:hypothetical protein